MPTSQWWAPINVPYTNQADWEPEPISAEEQKRIPKDLDAPYPGEVYVTASAGAAMWHSGTLKKGSAHRRMLHLTYTRRDLPQQLVQLDHRTQGFYDRMSPVQRFLLEIEPPGEGGVLRQPKRNHKGWWN